MTDDYTSTHPRTEGASPATTDTAKDEAAHLKDRATDAGGHLLDEAKGEATAVTQEARRQLDDLWSQARSEVSSQAGTQQQRLAGGLTSVGDQLTQMASSTSEQGIATDVVREVGTRVDTLGRWLEDRGPQEILDEVRSFARRRPGTFLLVAAGAGVVVGRLTRGLKDASPSGASGTASTPARTSAPQATAPQTTAPTQDLPVYEDVVEDRPRFTEAPGAPVSATPGWEQR